MLQAFAVMNKVNILLPVLILSMLLVHYKPVLAQQTHTVILAGYNNVPKVQTPARGSMEITLNGDSLSVEGSFTDLSGYYFGSGIFYGEKDEQGNKIISLKPTLAENKTNGTFEESNNTFKLTEGQLEALSEGNLYISIMSFENQRGEIRAQLPAFN